MTPQRAAQAIAMIDLTNLDDRADRAAIERLCATATEHAVAAVCVWPDFVAQAGAVLADSSVGVATVTNFPTGDERPYAVAAVTALAVDDGADEIDVVMPYRALLANDVAWVEAVLGAARMAADDRILKVILETGELPDQETVRVAAELAIGAGADFIKTSTGKSPVSATPEAVTTMLETVAAADRPVGIKAAGGIRTAADAERYLALADRVVGSDWATPSTFRLGASSLLEALLAV